MWLDLVSVDLQGQATAKGSSAAQAAQGKAEEAAASAQVTPLPLWRDH